MNICTRCGKLRVVVKTYQEKVGNSIVVYTINECPDPLCQKIVNGQLRDDEKRRVLVRNDQKKRELLRKEAFLRRKQLATI